MCVKGCSQSKRETDTWSSAEVSVQCIFSEVVETRICLELVEETTGGEESE